MLEDMTKKYVPTIGLEIHAELATETKMFCRCKNNPDAELPNAHVCPVCMGHPGTLPVINKQAVKHVITVGYALGGDIAGETNFDRKNYFYPDIPKAYQISQYKRPLVSGGSLLGMDITRIHLEEDTARSSHETDKGSLVDYNRAGLPLMELVTDPVIHSGADASRFASELQLLLRTLGVAHANMEKGEMRVEANISVSDSDKLGVKVEVKNLNSFRSVERAVEYEIERHIRAIESGEEIVQETRGWDENKQKTFSQRSKENAHDYRYFPDPDLPELNISKVSDFSKEVIMSSMPELPWVKRERYMTDLGMNEDTVLMLLTNPSFADFTEKTLSLVSDEKQKKLIINYLTSDLVGLIKQSTDSSREYEVPETITPEAIASLIAMTANNELSSRGTKDVLAELYKNGGEPKKVAEKLNVLQKNDTESLTKVVLKVLSENEKVVAEYKSGKEQLLQFFVGQCMKETKGSANPGILVKLIKENLK